MATLATLATWAVVVDAILQGSGRGDSPTANHCKLPSGSLQISMRWAALVRQTCGSRTGFPHSGKLYVVVAQVGKDMKTNMQIFKKTPYRSKA